jgi:hypothetical protein
LQRLSGRAMILSQRPANRHGVRDTIGLKRQDLAVDTRSDDLPFVKGVAGEIRDFIHSPFGAASAAATQLRLAAEMALGKVSPGIRTDPGGILIELLPSRIRDHIPDRTAAHSNKNAI